MERIADYADGSGTYRIERAVNTMITTINDTEIIRQRLTRHRAWDNEPRADYQLTARFASTPDGPDGRDIVWIDGVAYFADHIPDTEPAHADIVELVSLLSKHNQIDSRRAELAGVGDPDAASMAAAQHTRHLAQLATVYRGFIERLLTGKLIITDVDAPPADADLVMGVNEQFDDDDKISRDTVACGTASFTIPGEDDARFEISTWISEDDAQVVQIDTNLPETNRRVRVYVNDGSVFDRDIETGIDYGDDLHG
ncbi:hypothetical protein ACFVAJ_17580 [Agromyces sp. NPDC057679]|uniref:hypothetical protein n=1 Tax=Agromyces sp. NPDC057679 TaxID=3346207 RepID=UPI00366ACDAE